ncbi:unnamed protein product, partial [Darwinula stevensoni]
DFPEIPVPSPEGETRRRVEQRERERREAEAETRRREEAGIGGPGYGRPVYGRRGSEDALRFLARMEGTRSPVDETRRFVLSFYVEDRSLHIYEIFINRHLGIRQGRFLSRTRVKRGDTGEALREGDFHVGATLPINGFHFHLLQADDFTVGYMEGHPEQFPQSDVRRIREKVAAAMDEGGKKLLEFCRRVVALLDPDQRGLCRFHAFREELGKETELSSQEWMTLCRAYAAQRDHRPSLDAIVWQAQRELEEKGFEDFLGFRDYLEGRERPGEEKGKFTHRELMNAARGFRLPLSPLSLSAVLDALTQGKEEELPYKNVVEMLDYVAHPIAPPQVPDEDAPSFRYADFLQDLQDVRSPK